MPDINLNLNELIKSPWSMVFVLLAVILLYSIQYIVPSYLENRKGEYALEVERGLKVVEAELKLKAFLDSERLEVSDLFADLVETYDVPAWVKYFDPLTQRFRLVVTNGVYADTFGTPIYTEGMTGEEVYAQRNLPPEMYEHIAQYEINDRKAVVARNRDRCMLFREKVFPVTSPPEYRQYKKCALRYGSQVYVMGHRAE